MSLKELKAFLCGCGLSPVRLNARGKIFLLKNILSRGFEEILNLPLMCL